jgi:hypothetical protein
MAVSVTELLDGHVGLEVECLDRVYLNAYVPNLQVSGQVVTFLTRHRGQPIPSPALFARIGNRFRDQVARYARDHQIPLLHFGKHDRKIDKVRPLLAAAEQAERPGVVAIGWRRNTRMCSPPPSAAPLLALRSSPSGNRTGG